MKNKFFIYETKSKKTGRSCFTLYKGEEYGDNYIVKDSFNIATIEACFCGIKANFKKVFNNRKIKMV